VYEYIKFVNINVYMVSTEKPKTITITLGDRKEGRYKSFVVYGETLEDLEKKIKKSLKELE